MAKKEWKNFGSSLAQGAISDLSSGMLSNLVSLPFNIFYQRQALKNDKERMQTQADLNREQYLLEHSMESPIAMRANLEHAGLNPALMYSQGGLASGMNATVGTTSVSTSAPQTAVSAKQTSLNNLLGLHRLESEIENIQADTEQKLSQATYNRTLQQIADDRAELSLELLRGQVKNQEIVNEIRSIEKLFAEGINAQNVELLKARVADLKNQITNRDKVSAIEAKRVNAYAAQADAQIEKWGVDNAYTQARTEGQKTENKFQAESIENRLRKLNNETVTSYYEALSAQDKQLVQKMDRIIQERAGGMNIKEAKTVYQAIAMVASTLGYDTWDDTGHKATVARSVANTIFGLFPGSNELPKEWKEKIIDFLTHVL